MDSEFSREQQAILDAVAKGVCGIDQEGTVTFCNDAVKSAAPETVRVMLTRDADMDTAVQAINEGSIFRFSEQTLR